MHTPAPQQQQYERPYRKRAMCMYKRALYTRKTALYIRNLAVNIHECAHTCSSPAAMWKAARSRRRRLSSSLAENRLSAWSADLVGSTSAL